MVTRTLDAADRVTLVDYPDDTLDTTYACGTDPMAFDVGRLVGITRDGETVLTRAPQPEGAEAEGRNQRRPCPRACLQQEAVCKRGSLSGKIVNCVRLCLQEFDQRLECPAWVCPPCAGCIVAAHVYCFVSCTDDTDRDPVP